jgi:hypothetical protein
MSVDVRQPNGCGFAGVGEVLGKVVRQTPQACVTLQRLPELGIGHRRNGRRGSEKPRNIRRCARLNQ